MKLARLQQFTTLGAILLAGLWAAWAWRSGNTLAAVGGAVLIVGGYAAVLALEFALLRLAHGTDDPTPRASTRELLSAWWGEVCAAPAVFCWQQPFFSHRWPDQLPQPEPGAAPRRGVLLVHGFVCNRGFWNPWLKRLHAQQTPVVAVNLEPVFGSIDAYLLTIEQAVMQLERSTGLPPVVVAHSMGGLVLRRWWAEQAGEGRIHHAITIGTPHQGTWLARFALTRNARQMRQHSHWLQTLAAREVPQRRSRLTCFYSHCDNIVFPPATATLPGASNRHLPAQAHVQMAGSAEPWEELQWQLRVGDAEAPAAQPDPAESPTAQR